MDERKSNGYLDRLRKLQECVRGNDLALSVAQTDVKGDRQQVAIGTGTSALMISELSEERGGKRRAVKTN